MKINLCFCGIAVILFLLVLIISLIHGTKEDKSNRVPIIFICGLYLVGEIYVTYKYILRIPGTFQQYVIIAQIGVFIVILFLIFALSSSNKYIKGLDAKQYDSTKDFYNIRTQIKIEATQAKDEKSRAVLNDLSKTIGISDPVSNYDVTDINNSILNELMGLSSKEYDDIVKTAAHIKELLKIRELKNRKH